jgi:CRP-like cAMP-binding protein
MTPRLELHVSCHETATDSVELGPRRARIAETLLELTRDVGETCTHGFAVDVRITQQDLADLVGASRQMVNRILREMFRDFYLKKAGAYICILDVERLRVLAESQP